MTPDRHERVREIFGEAMDLAPAVREEFIRRAAADDEPLALEVLSLFDFHDVTVVSGRGSAGDRERFAPGDVFSDRYEIEALLGRGGMGEVWRAHDRLLGERIALKFVRGGSAASIDRALEEARLARRVTHPAICRLHDVGREGSEFYLSMEWIDGEDLRTRLDRLGSLPVVAALGIFQQVAGGVAAAHARGILHRDLKPANMLIDLAGHVRLTDFGIASRLGNAEAALVGTPAYMAPELFAGTAPSVRSDIWALAVVLFEAIAGEHPFGDRRHTRIDDAVPPHLSAFIHGVDPRLDEALATAMAADPAARFASILEFATCLPGGDALAVAEDAGVLPSPEIVAASADADRTSKRWGWAVASIGLAALVLFVTLSQLGSSLTRASVPLPPDELVRRAAAGLAAGGWPGVAVDEAWGFTDEVPRSITSGELFFWYRRSDRPMSFLEVDSHGRILPEQPPTLEPGEAIVWLSPSGSLVAINGSVEVAPPEAPESRIDWARLTAAAGLDVAVATGRSPAFSGSIELPVPSNSDPTPVAVRVEATRGRVTSWSRVQPGSPPAPREAQRPSPYDVNWSLLFRWMFRSGVSFLALPLALANLVRRRTDPAGALRLAGAILASLFLGLLLCAHHQPDIFSELRLLRLLLADSLYDVFFVWGLYLAAEPFARRYWPRLLVASSRLIAGKARDPLVGRSLAAGTAAGVTWAVVQLLARLVPGWAGLGGGGLSTDYFKLDTAMSIRRSLTILLERSPGSVFRALFVLLLLVALRLLFRHRWAAALAAISFLTYAEVLVGGSHPAVSCLILGAGVAGSIVILVRFGLVAYAVAYFVRSALGDFPVAFDLGAWWARASLVPIGLVLGLMGLGLFWAYFESPRPDLSRPPSRA